MITIKDIFTPETSSKMLSLYMNNIINRDNSENGESPFNEQGMVRDPESEIWKSFYMQITGKNPNLKPRLKKLKDKDIFFFKQTDVFDKGGKIRKAQFDMEINGKVYHTLIAKTNYERKKGFSNTYVEPGKAMLFIFPKSGHHQMWMKDTLNDLTIVFLNNELKIIETIHGVTGETKLLGSSDDVSYVIEFLYDEKLQNLPEDTFVNLIPKKFQKEKKKEEKEEPVMELLDDDGKKQMALKGGERVFSREKTKEIVEKSKKAKSKKDLIDLAETVSNEILAQDNRPQEYVVVDSNNGIYAKNGGKLEPNFKFKELGNKTLSEILNVIYDHGFIFINSK